MIYEGKNIYDIFPELKSSKDKKLNK